MEKILESSSSCRSLVSFVYHYYSFLIIILVVLPLVEVLPRVRDPFSLFLLYLPSQTLITTQTTTPNSPTQFNSTSFSISSFLSLSLSLISTLPFSASIILFSYFLSLSIISPFFAFSPIWVLFFPLFPSSSFCQGQSRLNGKIYSGT